MERPLHHRAFVVTVGWTLVLLFLGSVVHATESSLACPDWPTCYGSWMPEMTGGVFWEHLHRLVAGGLVLMWLLATWLVWAPAAERTWLRKAALGGIALLAVQSVLGGVTVLLRLPTSVSTAHLGLAFAFLSLATVMAIATAPGWGSRRDADVSSGRWSPRPWALTVAALVFLQSLLGGWVRHAGAGMACPSLPLCLDEWVPPLEQLPVALHWAHRVGGVIVGLAVLALAWAVVRRSHDARMRATALAAGALVVVQIALGVLSVETFLAVLPVSLHTLVAAALLTAVVALAARAREPVRERRREAPAGRRAPAVPGG